MADTTFRICGQVYPLSAMVAANCEDEEFCAWALKAKPGDVYPGIGELCECVEEVSHG